MSSSIDRIQLPTLPDQPRVEGRQNSVADPAPCIIILLVNGKFYVVNHDSPITRAFNVIFPDCRWDQDMLGTDNIT